MNDMTPDELSLTVERRINALVERVCQAWLEPATLTRFFGNCRSISLTRAETDPRSAAAFCWR